MTYFCLWNNIDNFAKNKGDKCTDICLKKRKD